MLLLICHSGQTPNKIPCIPKGIPLVSAFKNGLDINCLLASLVLLERRITGDMHTEVLAPFGHLLLPSLQSTCLHIGCLINTACMLLLQAGFRAAVAERAKRELATREKAMRERLITERDKELQVRLNLCKQLPKVC